MPGDFLHVFQFPPSVQTRAIGVSKLSVVCVNAVQEVAGFFSLSLVLNLLATSHIPKEI